MMDFAPLMKAIAALVAVLVGFSASGGSVPSMEDVDSAPLTSDVAMPTLPTQTDLPDPTELTQPVGETNPGGATVPVVPSRTPADPEPADLEPADLQPTAPLPADAAPAAPALPAAPTAPVAPAATVPPVATAPPAGVGAGEVAITPGAGETVRVATAQELTAALAAAQPGQTIELADGTYSDKFVLNQSGQQGSPITLKGSRGAILDGGSGSGYAVHMDGANYWQLVGFTITGAEKGIMTDQSSNNLLSDLDVGNTGAEAIHLRNFSSDNVVQRSIVHDTGGTKPQYGEGLYFGSAKSNWGSDSGGQPDKSDRNQAINNVFRSIAAENIDVKEETSGGVISGNQFDASAISGENYADSVIDMKGFNYQIVNNVTTGSSPHLLDGFQTHVITEPATSGCNNTFENNTFDGVTFNGGQEIALDKKCDDA